MLFAPFRSGAAHVVVFRPVFPGWPVPGWTQKGQQRADASAEDGEKNGCAERRLSHAILHAKKTNRHLPALMADISLHERRVERNREPNYLLARS
jgi:hypothetical protein